MFDHFYPACETNPAVVIGGPLCSSGVATVTTYSPRAAVITSLNVLVAPLLCLLWSLLVCFPIAVVFAAILIALSIATSGQHGYCQQLLSSMQAGLKLCAATVCTLTDA